MNEQVKSEVEAALLSALRRDDPETRAVWIDDEFNVYVDQPSPEGRIIVRLTASPKLRRVLFESAPGEIEMLAGEVRLEAAR